MANNGMKHDINKLKMLEKKSEWANSHRANVHRATGNMFSWPLKYWNFLFKSVIYL